ncbi:unnamed protein product [Rotaria socialis]|uniref:Uncharacterized protein n=1 Tax=Rotaria socialis TaxID=392032 RepID=A0A818GNI5_9BILA|nr:unnamed protein product [Rotaria socialis]CAF4444295.1 unnamed protein product [Rotaria socialis]
MFKNSIWKILLALGIILAFVAFILGWIGFGVPDWHSFRRYNTSFMEYYGLWAYCQDQSVTYGTVCQRWPTAENILFNGTRPSFIRTSEGLITTGMILLSLSLVAAIVSAVLPYLVYLAGLIAILSFIFLVIGVPLFGIQSNNLSITVGNVYYNKRYGFWLMVPTIVLEFSAAFLFILAGLAYKLFSYGNFFTSFSGRPYGGQQKLGPPHVLAGATPRYAPYGSSAQLFTNDRLLPGVYPNPYGSTIPPLLSQYLNQRLARNYESLGVPPMSMNVLPRPSALSAMRPAPSYLRVGEPLGSRFTPIVNLSGQTLVGPIMRTG